MLISIEGLPGAGKSTLRKFLERKLEDYVSRPSSTDIEALREMMKYNNLDFLTQSITEAKNNAICLIEWIGHISKEQNTILERDYLSVLSYDHLFDLRKKTNIYPEIHQIILDNIKNDHLRKPDLRIYLNPGVQTCLLRQKSRNKDKDTGFRQNFEDLSAILEYQLNFINQYEYKNTIIIENKD